MTHCDSLSHFRITSHGADVANLVNVVYLVEGIYRIVILHPVTIWVKFVFLLFKWVEPLGLSDLRHSPEFSAGH